MQKHAISHDAREHPEVNHLPIFQKIDHIHLHTDDRLELERWYSRVLGFERVPELEVWMEGGGPLTIHNGGAHLALFEPGGRVSTTIALAVDGENYFQWMNTLSDHSVSFREVDHDLSWSIYFKDPDGNPFEITTYDVEYVCRHKP
ncbi:VOC family protein [Saccharospirillum sp. HFRX-1]|uniref:VOC family protein n=1 Tax=unclassified Saccharospirillum TaxID=2633430 RepID=UPI00371F946D